MNQSQTSGGGSMPTGNMGSGSGGSSKGLWSIIILLIIVALAYGAYQKWGNSQVPAETEENTEEATNTAGMPVPGEENVTETVVEGDINVALGTKTFTLVGKPFSYSLAEIRVKEGDRVKIVFQNEEGQHDWGVDEFAARTAVLKTGETATVEFVASKKGNFEYYCSVGQHRAMGMKGTLVVE
ncbi:MAG TPA: cupredoxin domain-containing protein [Candidatus Paceibacterota bacterium]